MTGSNHFLENRQNSCNDQVEMGRTISPTTTFLNTQQCSSYARQESKGTRDIIKCIMFVSLGFNLLAIPALSAVAVLYVQSHNCTPQAVVDAPDLICYPCGEGGIPGVPSAERTSNGYCCASKRNGEMQRLIRGNILPESLPVVQQNSMCAEETQESGDRPNKRKFRLKTAAHLIVKVDETKEAKELKWSSMGTAFLQGHLEIRNSTVRVKKGGLYRIRSHFSFDSVTTKDNDFDVNFDHCIYKINKDGTHTKLKLEKTKLRRDQYMSSDVDLIAKLRENEDIGVFIQTFRYLFGMDIANTLDIEKID